MLVHLRLNVPTDLTDAVRDTLSDDARLTNLTHLRGASLKPAGDVFEADVAREAATAVLDDLNAVGLGHRGGIVIGQPLGTPFDAAHDVDLVAIPGGSTSGDYPEEILETLRSVVANGGRVLTVCSGAFVAAAAGLLDGRRCTTHWAYGEKLARMYPAALVDTDVLFVDDGPITTSAGTAGSAASAASCASRS